MPSSFDPNDTALKAVPRPYEWRWESCEDILRAGNATIVMSMLPFFWQLASPLHKICTAVGAPLFSNQPENMPVGAAAIQDAGINAVLSTPQDAAAFSLFLLERNVPLPATWLLVYSGAAAAWDIPISLNDAQTVAREVHLCPGLPLLVQCPAQARAHAEDFHLSKEFAWDFADKTPRVSIKDASLLPLHLYSLPFSLAEKGACSCKEAQYARV